MYVSTPCRRFTAQSALIHVPIAVLSASVFDLSRYDAAIVDLDGTMVDTIGDFSAALGLMLDELELPPISAHAVKPMVGKGSEHLIGSVLDHVLASTGTSQTPALFNKACERYQHYYRAVNGQYSAVFPGVNNGLKLFRDRGVRLACLTNKPTAFARPLLASKGLDGFFEVVFGGDAFERKKPDPMPLIKTCEHLGTSPSRTLMLGDSSNDARAARAAGCPVVLVTYGYNHGEPVRDVDADGVVDSLAEFARQQAGA